MKNYIIGFIGGAYKSLFGGFATPPVGFTPPASVTTALNAVGSNFTTIGDIMLEGKVTPALGEHAIQKCYEAQLAVNAAITYGWNNGNPSTY